MPCGLLLREGVTKVPNLLNLYRQKKDKKVLTRLRCVGRVATVDERKRTVQGYTGNLISGLMDMVDRTERETLEDASKKRNALSGYEQFPLILPCWHPHKTPTAKLIAALEGR